MFKAAHIFTLALATALCVPAVAQDAVGGANLKKLVSGLNGQGDKFSIQYKADGSVTMKEGADVYKGTWRIENDAVCNKFKKLRGGAETCRTVMIEGPNKYRFTRTDNGATYVLTVK